MSALGWVVVIVVVLVLVTGWAIVRAGDDDQ